MKIQTERMNFLDYFSRMPVNYEPRSYCVGLIHIDRTASVPLGYTELPRLSDRTSQSLKRALDTYRLR